MKTTHFIFLAAVSALLALIWQYEKPGSPPPLSVEDSAITRKTFPPVVQQVESRDQAEGSVQPTYSPETEQKSSLNTTYQHLRKEMEQGNYQNTHQLQDILAFCHGIPATEEDFLSWQQKHPELNDNEQLSMQEHMMACSQVPRLNLRQRKALFYQAVEHGAYNAYFALAKNMPYGSLSELDYLVKASLWDETYVTHILQRATNKQTHMSPLSRLFWTRVATEVNIDTGDLASHVANYEGELTNLEQEKVQALVKLWQSRPDSKPELLAWQQKIERELSKL